MQGEPVEILLVEDDPDHAELVIRILQDNQVSNQIRHICDGEAALDYLFQRGEYADAERSPFPHLVLLDLRLPRIDGLEVLRQIRSDDRTKRLPVVVLTSSKEDQDLMDSYNLGANSYIRKPVDFIQFTEAVRQLGTYWLVLNEPPPG